MNRLFDFVKTLTNSAFILPSKIKRITQSGIVNGVHTSAEPDLTHAQGMELELLDKKLRRLVCKLKKHEIFLEVFDHGDIQYGALLGRGGEAEVHKCTVIYNSVPVEAAVKTVTSCDEDAISITLDEIELLCLSRDPIINPTVQVYGVAAVPDDDNPEMGHLVIVTEAGLMNSLQLYQDEAIPLNVTFDLWKRLAGALYTMHNRKIIHQDVKPENILVTAINRDKSGNIERIEFKIIDLGMGKRVYTERVVTDDIFGTNGYHAPEVLFEDSYDFRADIFMLGITFCVLLHSREFLKSKSKLSGLLTQIHKAKETQTGRCLFDKVISPTFEDNQNIPSTINNMLCNMLEEADKRTMTLIDVIHRCGIESDKTARMLRNGASPPVLQAWGVNTDSPDSGVGSGDGCSKSLRPRRRAVVKRRSGSAASSAIVSDATSTRTYRTRSTTSSVASSTTSTKSGSRMAKRELASLFEPWMGEELGMRRGMKRLRSQVSVSVIDKGHKLRKRERINYNDADKTDD